jgi:hypothetical protein
MQQRPGSRSCAKSTVAPEGTSADKHGAAGVDPNPRSNSVIPFRRATNRQCGGRAAFPAGAGDR